MKLGTSLMIGMASGARLARAARLALVDLDGDHCLLVEHQTAEEISQKF